jgi:hypothetical protein
MARRLRPVATLAALAGRSGDGHSRVGTRTRDVPHCRPCRTRSTAHGAVREAGGHAVFIAALLGEAAVIACWKLTPLSFLWWNLIGCVLTVAGAALLAIIESRSTRSG